MKESFKKTPSVVQTPTMEVENLGKPNLSEKELKILQLVAEGYSNLNIGSILGVSERSIKNYLRNIGIKIKIRKTDTHNVRQRMVDEVLKYGLIETPKNKSVDKKLFETLTPKEKEVLDVLAKDRSILNKGIALKFNTTEQVIKNHLKTICDKLNCATRYDAVEYFKNLQTMNSRNS